MVGSECLLQPLPTTLLLPNITLVVLRVGVVGRGQALLLPGSGN